jgi:hypothetical protein
MADDRKKVGKPDRIRINVNEPYEVGYWSRKFGTSAANLHKVVRQVGPMVKNVKKKLQD